MFSAPHTATVGRLVQSYSLKYKSGTAVFTAGKTLTSLTGSATILSTGSAASGTLVIHSITGTFTDGQALADDGTIPGAALADGTTSITLDSYGQPSKSTVNSSVSCRFFNIVSSNPRTGAVTYAQDDLGVMLPPTATVGNGDTLTSTDTGYADTFTICELKPAYALGTLHHYTAQLTRLP
jgi:hypothetical protein